MVRPAEFRQYDVRLIDNLRQPAHLLKMAHHLLNYLETPRWL